MMENYTVYCHTLKADGRKYFGATKDRPKHRWNNGKGHSYGGKMRKAIDEYGWDAFEHTIIKDGLSSQEAWDMEISLIKEYNTTDERFGFNSSTGGQKTSIGCKFSQETIAKITQKTRGLKRSKEFCEKLSNRMKGKKLSEEAKQKLREANLGKKQSSETIEKRRQKIIGKKYPNRKKWNEESRKRLSEAMMGHPTSEETRKKLALANAKPVICIETNIVYKSAREAERQTNVNYKLISMNCTGKCKSVYGKHWQFYKPSESVF